MQFYRIKKNHTQPEVILIHVLYLDKITTWKREVVTGIRDR